MSITRSHSLTPPPAHPTRPLTSRERHHLVRERTFVGAELPEVLLVLRESSAVGTLYIDIVNGGIGTIRFREEQKVQLTSK